MSMLNDDHDRIDQLVTDAGRSLPEDMPEPARTILSIERLTWKYDGYKNGYVREKLGLNPNQYHQLWQRMLDDPEIEAIDPITVRRWRRTRAVRQSKGRSRSLGLTI